MTELAKLPQDMVFFTQITMESAEDTEYLDAMRCANIKDASVGVEAVTPEGLKAVSFSCTGGPSDAVQDRRARPDGPGLLRPRCSRLSTDS
jgi:hypothetical protein